MAGGGGVHHHQIVGRSLAVAKDGVEERGDGDQLVDPRRRFGSDDLVIINDLAGRVALAIDNAKLHAATRAALAEQQHSLALLDSVRRGAAA